MREREPDQGERDIAATAGCEKKGIARAFKSLFGVLIRQKDDLSSEVIFAPDIYTYAGCICARKDGKTGRAGYCIKSKVLQRQLGPESAQNCELCPGDAQLLRDSTGPSRVVWLIYLTLDWRE